MNGIELIPEKHQWVEFYDKVYPLHEWYSDDSEDHIEDMALEVGATFTDYSYVKAKYYMCQIDDDLYDLCSDCDSKSKCCGTLVHPFIVSGTITFKVLSGFDVRIIKYEPL